MQSALRQQRQTAANPAEASSLFKSRILNPVHLNQVSKEKVSKSTVKREDNGFQEEENVALNTEKRTKKHWKQNKYEYGYDYNYKRDHYQMPQHKPYQRKQDSEPQMHKNRAKAGPPPKISSPDSDNGSMNSPSIKHKAPNKPPPVPTTSQHILITKKSLNAKADVKERTKDFRLKGSDLYVARLGNCNTTPPIVSKFQVQNTTCSPASPIPSPKSEPSCLYDELSPLSRNSYPHTAPTKSTIEKPEVRASRPCYRCVSAMHAVGIKRVFWTNADGEWEVAKVRGLVEALENGIEGDDMADLNAGQEKTGVFVMKHEVLMLKRIMGF